MYLKGKTGVLTIYQWLVWKLIVATILNIVLVHTPWPVSLQISYLLLASRLIRVLFLTTWPSPSFLKAFELLVALTVWCCDRLPLTLTLHSTTRTYSSGFPWVLLMVFLAPKGRVATSRPLDSHGQSFLTHPVAFIFACFSTVMKKSNWTW